MVERIVYAVYSEPTAFLYSFPDCADRSGNDGPNGCFSTHGSARIAHGITGWHKTGDIRADLSDDAGNVPMTGMNSRVTAFDA